MEIVLAIGAVLVFTAITVACLWALGARRG